MLPVPTRFLVSALALAVLADPLGAAPGDKFPVKPVRIVVPSTPTGALDLMSRIMGPYLTERWGEQVVIDNRAGAGGIIGTEVVAKSPPDGHTLLIVTTGFTTNPFLVKKLPYRTLDDFAPVTLIGSTLVLLVAHPSLPARTGKELVALAKRRPGEIVFASSGVGSGGHLTMVLLQQVAGVKFNHVPYKGAGASNAAVVSGEAQLLFTATGAALPHIKSGRLRPIMVTGKHRTPTLPEVPSVVEAGLPDCVMEQWYGYIAPGGTPPALVERIHSDMVAVMQVPDVATKLQAAGFKLEGTPPAEFRRYLLSELKRWEPIIRKADLGEQP